MRNPRQFESTMSYGSSGALEVDQNAAGGFWRLTRSELGGGSVGYQVGVTSAMNRQASRRVSLLPTGDKERTSVNADGSTLVRSVLSNGTTTRTSPDLTVTKIIEHADPRFGMLAPLVDTTTTLPSGLVSSLTTNRSVVLSNPSDALSLTSETTTTILNGKSWTMQYVNASRQTTSTSPLGRMTTLRTDAAGRVTFMQVSGLEAVNYGYDARGRLKTVSQGSGGSQRSLTVNHDPVSGFVSDLTDALPQTVAFQRDAIGRPNSLNLPGNRLLGMDFDANSNLSGVTPPGKPRHAIEANPVDLEASYTPPAVPGIADPATRSSYNLDRQLTRIDRPDGTSLVLGYKEPQGQLQTITPSAGAGEPVTLAYSATTGQLQSVTTTDATQAFGYDGMLLQTETLTGGVAGTLAWEYNNNLLVKKLTVNGVATNFAYDDDLLLTQAGALAITRHPQHGLPQATALANVTTSQTYNGFGEPELFTASAAGSPLYSLALSYDKAGRVGTKTETLAGTTSVFEYGYDTAGRLQTVKLNGTQTANWGYDANGNRSTLNGATIAGYDSQDRLQTHGSASYEFTAAGSLQQKTQGGQTTTYGYDIFGNLRSVNPTDSPSISYLIDGSHRRVAKKINGNVVQRFIYQDRLEIAAELDATGAIVSRFTYGLRPNVPEFMVKAGVTYRIITDHLGSVRLVVDSSTGAVAQRIDYDEWGRVTADSNPGFQPFGFAGGLYDRDTGLVRFGARDYDAETGRWTAKDPIGFEGGDANLYTYVGGNPISSVDPTGEYGVGGAVAGGLINFGVQFGTAWRIGGDWKLALRCVNWTDVAMSAGMGFIGPSLGQIARGVRGPYGYSAGVDLFQYVARAVPAGFAAKKILPDFRLADDCECKDFKLPALLGELLH